MTHQNISLLATVHDCNLASAPSPTSQTYNKGVSVVSFSMVFFSFFSTFSLFFPFLVPVAPNQIYRSQSKARRERKWERACVNTTVQKSQSCLLHLFMSSSCHPQPRVLFSLTLILLCLSSALAHFSFFVFNHVIGLSDLVDLWVIKIKSPWSFADVVHRVSWPEHETQITLWEHVKGLFIW